MKSFIVVCPCSQDIKWNILFLDEVVWEKKWIMFEVQIKALENQHSIKFIYKTSNKKKVQMMRIWELLANSSPIWGFFCTEKKSVFFQYGYENLWKKMTIIVYNFKSLFMLASKFKPSETLNINVLYRTRAVHNEGKREGDLVPGSVTNDHSKAEQQFPQSVPWQKVLIRSTFVRLLPPCVSTWGKDFFAL